MKNSVLNLVSISDFLMYYGDNTRDQILFRNFSDYQFILTR